jgi:hypothetical protein
MRARKQIELALSPARGKNYLAALSSQKNQIAHATRAITFPFAMLSGAFSKSNLNAWLPQQQSRNDCAQSLCASLPVE